MEDHGQQRPDLTNGPDTDTKEGSDFVETNAEAVLDLNPTAFVDDLYNAVREGVGLPWKIETMAECFFLLDEHSLALVIAQKKKT